MLAVLLASLLAVAQAQTAAAPTEVDVLGTDGSWRTGVLEDRGAVRGEDGSNLLQRAIAWIPRRERAPQQRRSLGAVQLSDGQRLVGTFGGFVTNESGSVSRWKNLNLGSLSIPINQTAKILFESSAGAGTLEAIDSDVLLLRNGDRVAGFVKSVGTEVEMESQGTIQPVPVERIAAMALVHAEQKGGPIRVWFNDGSILDATKIENGFAGGFVGGFVLRGLTLVEKRSNLPVMPDDIDGIVLQSQRLRPLAHLTPRMEEPTAAMLPRASHEPPQVADVQSAPLSAATITLRGPIRLVYEIPEGFTILSATAEIPPALRRWGDLVLVIRQDEKELLRQPMSAAHPNAAIALPIVAGALEIEVEEAGHGPVGDTVILARPLLIRAN